MQEIWPGWNPEEINGLDDNIPKLQAWVFEYFIKLFSFENEGSFQEKILHCVKDWKTIVTINLDGIESQDLAAAQKIDENLAEVLPEESLRSTISELF